LQNFVLNRFYAIFYDGTASYLLRSSILHKSFVQFYFFVCHTYCDDLISPVNQMLHLHVEWNAQNYIICFSANSSPQHSGWYVRYISSKQMLTEWHFFPSSKNFPLEVTHQRVPCMKLSWLKYKNVHAMLARENQQDGNRAPVLWNCELIHFFFMWHFSFRKTEINYYIKNIFIFAILILIVKPETSFYFSITICDRIPNGILFIILLNAENLKN